MFCRAVLEVQTKSQIGHQLQTDALTKTNGRKKILYMFRYFCLRYGRDLQNNLVKIQIPLTKQEIANWVGLTRETVTIALHRLAGQGIIRSEKKYYLVDTKKLNRRIVDEYDSGIWINKLHQ
jgi:CRP/FNR family transcriptional regulator